MQPVQLAQAGLRGSDATPLVLPAVAPPPAPVMAPPTPAVAPAGTAAGAPGATPSAAPVVAPMSTGTTPLGAGGGRSEGGRNAPPAVLVPADAAAPLRTEVAQLDRNSREAVRQTRDFVSRDNLPAAGDDGRVLYTFGAGMPTVVCAPLRICTVDLQPGERVVGALHAGDTVRWVIAPAESGSGRAAVTHVVIKPKEPGLETNLMIPTDRRVYHLRLVSRPNDFVARVAFSYPDDAKLAWDAYRERQAELQRTVVSDLPQGAVERLNFDYRTEGTRRFIPVRVFDDGQKTYIQLPPDMRHREAPALVLLGRDGNEQIVNYRKRDDFYVVDRLFERAALILGVGRQQERVTIERIDRNGDRAWWPFASSGAASRQDARDSRDVPPASAFDNNAP